MPESKQYDYDGMKETISAIREAQKKAEENPADKETVEDFRKKPTYPPSPVRAPRTFRPKREYSGQKSLSQKVQFYKSTFLEGYRNLAALGLDESTIERLFGLKSQFLLRHIETDEQYQLAYQEAMSLLENRLARLMLVRAIGYEYEEEKTIYCKKGTLRKRSKDGEKTAAYNPHKIVGDKWMEYRKEIFKKHQPGDTQMFIFFMTNKFPDKWKVSRELLTGKAETYDGKPSQRIRKSIEVLARDVFEQNTNRPETEHPVQNGLAPISDGSDEDGKE